MTFVTLFQSWQFWLLIVVSNIASGIFGFAMYSIFAINSEEDDEVDLTYGDISVELLKLREENRVFRIESEVLRKANQSLNEELDALCPDTESANHAVHVTESRPDKAV